MLYAENRYNKRYNDQGDESLRSRFMSSAFYHTMCQSRLGKKNEANTKTAIQNSHQRLKFGWGGVLFISGLIGLRLLDLTLLGSNYTQRTYKNQLNATTPLANRASILDRNGIIMASSLPSDLSLIHI